MSRKWLLRSRSGVLKSRPCGNYLYKYCRVVPPALLSTPPIAPQSKVMLCISATFLSLTIDFCRCMNHCVRCMCILDLSDAILLAVKGSFWSVKLTKELKRKTRSAYAF